MITYIAFLRGINVGGQKKIKMADLKLVLESAGLLKIRTYIQSGNFVFNSPMDASSLEDSIKNSIQKSFGFDVEVIVKEPFELKAVIENNPFKDVKDFNVKSMYFILLKNGPSNFIKKNVISNNETTELFELRKNIIYLYVPDGYGRTVYNNNYFENKLKVKATARNWNTINKMIELANNI